MISNARADINSVLHSLTLPLLILEVLSRQIWQHLNPKIGIFKLSGNTVKITHHGAAQFKKPCHSSTKVL